MNRVSRLMKKRTLQTVLFGAIFVCLSLHAVHAAEHQLTEQTKQAWVRYVQVTEQRIERELQNPVSLPQGDVEYLKQGRIHTVQRTTTDKGKEIQINNGTIHHWRGAIFVPAMNLEILLP